MLTKHIFLEETDETEEEVELNRMHHDLKAIFTENAAKKNVAKLLNRLDKVIDKIKMYSQKREVKCIAEELISLNER